MKCWFALKPPHFLLQGVVLKVSYLTEGISLLKVSSSFPSRLDRLALFFACSLPSCYMSVLWNVPHSEKNNYPRGDWTSHNTLYMNHISSVGVCTLGEFGNSTGIVGVENQSTFQVSGVWKYQGSQEQLWEPQKTHVSIFLRNIPKPSLALSAQWKFFQAFASENPLSPQNNVWKIQILSINLNTRTHKINYLHCSKTFSIQNLDKSSSVQFQYGAVLSSRVFAILETFHPLILYTHVWDAKLHNQEKFCR